MKKFTTYLSDMAFEDLAYLWNEYASENGYEQIYDSVEEFAANFGTEGAELARMVFFGDIKDWYDMVYLNGYGNFQSCWNVDNSPIDIDALAQWMRETNHTDYKEWLDSIDADDFADWLDDELTNEALTKLWSEYVQEVDEDDLEPNGLPLNFDVEDLAKELMADWHQHFDDFIEEHI
nr:MAG TPA: hypothetical protein [Caudoviricetes sp.]